MTDTDDDTTVPRPRVEAVWYERPAPASTPGEPEPMYPRRPFLWTRAPQKIARWLVGLRRPRIPVARARARWWRRLLAWFADAEIERCCPRCGEVLCLDSTCVGCMMHLALESKRDDAHASTVRRVLRGDRDPIAVPVPGPGVSSSR